MGLYEFRDKLILEYKGWWFIWEAAWEGFRPIHSIQWDGRKFQIDDYSYCSDPTHELYGYGSPQMRDLCELLKPQHEKTPIVVDTLPLKATEWFRDRHAALTTCAPRDVLSWKRMIENKRRTCRSMPRGKKFTRRTL